MRKAIARTLPLSLLVAGALAAPRPGGDASPRGARAGRSSTSTSSPLPQGTNRTWLGYVTGGPPLANGSATASDGATGAAVTHRQHARRRPGLLLRLPHRHRRHLRRVHAARARSS